MSEALPIGVAFLDKQPGDSSFRALSAVKRAFGTRKVGHTGTLDPFASGLLIGLVGRATRTARIFDGLPKTYTACFRFGEETDTDDLTGATVSECAPPEPTALHAALPAFVGRIEQTPPAYSAVHVNGKRAYELAREGQTVELRSRMVDVYRFDVTDERTEDDRLLEADVRIECSTGTYIRSLARDLARAAGSAAHVSELRRVRIGPFSVEDAVRPDEVEAGSLHAVAGAIGRIDGVAVVDVDATVAASVLHGRNVGPRELPGDWARARWILVQHDGTALAIGHAEDDRFVYDAVLGER